MYDEPGVVQRHRYGRPDGENGHYRIRQLCRHLTEKIHGLVSRQGSLAGRVVRQAGVSHVVRAALLWLIVIY